ncbi:MAG: ribosomal subunit interface protein [Candidatus Staskawiczbacteria bacterium RIFCSPHIGHO2_02_FULL_34_9]|uniref:Ribosomal subunit interface protein n=1 Tax=Candidatus Staskawiczbacteria bacterium RIFCSPHIGHO2_02_FULL_34_9 TaxID=1802206 RepID=A0A1G2I283_9BACT|nr:MAG: ribosomal subunit interface protein [Candidatus Staskawiczbacteria bacterium RIFCSPHIGHO2_02_FULL_34_9]
MKIIITTKNLDLTPSLNVLVNQKVEKLRKFINVLKEKLPEKGKSLAEVFVEIEKVSKHHKKGDVFKTEIIIVLPGKKLVSESHGSDLLKTVIEAKDELEIEIKKYKSRSAELVRKEQKRAENKL